MLGGADRIRTMRRFLLPLMLPTLLLVTACWFGSSSESIPLDEYEFTTVDISTFDGYIEVRSGNTAELDATFHLTEDDDLLEIELLGDVLVVRSLCMESMCSIDLDVVVPIHTEVIATSVDGDITVEEMENGAILYTGSGTIRVMDLEGELDAETIDGDVDLRDVDGDVFVTTFDGSVDGTAIGADHILVNATNGKVMLETNLPPLEAIIDTVSGGVDLTVPMDEYDLDLESLSGSVSIYGLDDIDDAANVISIHSTSGSISVTGD
jgi:putative adhesin